MNVFILNTGRCGSTTFIKACEHITNFTAAHESRASVVGQGRLDYPDNHIEADNRLSWFLGRLDDQYGDSAIYVHLRRNELDTANSFATRLGYGIMGAYLGGIYSLQQANVDATEIALDYCRTVDANIRLFLTNKSKVMTFDLENAENDFRKFWDLIGAAGDLEAAKSEFKINYNSSSNPYRRQKSLFNRFLIKIRGSSG